MMVAALFASLGVCAAMSASAQEAAAQRTDEEWREWVPAAGEVSMPSLTYVEDQDDRNNYEKYYYFHRPQVEFTTALADIRHCDELARGLYRGNWYNNAASYAVGGLVGGLIGGAIADAIHGSQQIRTNRRINMRRCMSYKGYQRYGLDKEVWEAFNFEEGNSEVPENERQVMLAQQALVASSTTPQSEELGL